LKFFVETGGRRWEIEFPAAGEVKQVKVDGRPVEVDFRRISGGTDTSIIINNRSFTQEVVRSSRGCRVQLQGFDLDVSVTDERSEAIRRMVGVSHDRSADFQELRAPMPGLVVKLGAVEGDKINLGQGVVVVEAMKMENEIPSPISGIVDKVTVQPGQAVEKGELLMVIKGGMTFQ